MSVTINCEEHHNYILLEVIGSIDSTNSRWILRYLNSVIDYYDKHLIIECSALRHMDSHGLDIFLKSKSRMLGFRMMVFCSLSSSIVGLVELSALDKVIPVVPDVIEAESILRELDGFYGVPHYNQNPVGRRRF